MTRHHCHSTRRESRPSNCALLNNERHRGCQKRSHTNIYSLAHAISMLPRTIHYCHSTRRGTRPSNYALSNDELSATALTSPMTLIHPPIYMSGKLSNVASSLSQRPSRIATEQLRALEQRAAHDCQNAPPPVDIYSLVPASSTFPGHR